MVTKLWHWFLKGRPERGWKGVCPKACFHCTRVTVRVAPALVTEPSAFVTATV
jgi:hypothetical protein